MSYNIKLYVHGVPKGQCSWGVEKFDGNYIDTFYGRKSSVPTQMLVEIRQFGSFVYSYYTYFVGNTSDNSGRTGGYFALTLRINYYYADIQNIYNLLDAAFNKFIIGPVINTASGVFKYAISDFLQVDTNLKALDQEINKYLMQFSSDSDFVSLNGFKVNGQNEIEKLNLLECDVKAVDKHIRNYSSIAISPYYPSSHEQQIINDMNAKINDVTTRAQQQIGAAHTRAQQEIKNANKEINRLEGIVNELKQKVKNYEIYKKKFEDSQGQLNAIRSMVCDDFSGSGGIAEVHRTPSNTSHDHGHRGGPKSNEENEGFSFTKIVRGMHPFTDLFVIIVLLGIVCFTLPKSCVGRENSSKELLAAIGQLEKQLEDIQNENKNFTTSPDGIDVNDNTVEAYQSALRKRFPNAKIDVAGIDENKPMRYGSADTYTVSLKNVEGELGGKWESNDFEISNGKLKPKHTGDCEISYIVNGEVLVSRVFTVTE